MIRALPGKICHLVGYRLQRMFRPGSLRHPDFLQPSKF
jgi:hypothetical protein